MSQSSERRILGPAIWMMVLSLLLCWLPLVGPLIAGYVGGRLAGGVGAAFLASILPAVVLGVAIFAAMSLFALPLLGLVLGIGVGVYILLGEIGLISGAIVGGLLAR